MFGIFLSALNVLLGFIFRSVIVRFFGFFFLFFVVEGFVGVLVSSGILPSAQSLNAGLSGIPAGVWYFLDAMAFSVGIKIVLSAYLTRFIIRRIPVIG